jgi:trans-aconitate methyltransferase
LDGALNLAPIAKDIHRVLDVGCGTGLWAVDFAEEHPSATVLGIDISPIQPELVPVNCSFRVDNVEDDWMPDEDYDYIHSRAMVPAMKNWPRFISQSFLHLKPGGYLELQDFCLPIRCQDSQAEAAGSSSTAKLFNGHLMDMWTRMGLDLAAPSKWHDYLQAAGFQEIHLQWYNWPIGPWAKHKKNKVIGRLTLVDFLDVITSVGPVLQKYLNWSSEEAEVLITKVRNELKEQKLHFYQPICFCYAKKPGLPPRKDVPTASSETATR